MQIAGFKEPACTELTCKTTKVGEYHSCAEKFYVYAVIILTGFIGFEITVKGMTVISKNARNGTHTKSYNAFKFSTAGCNPIPLALKGQRPTSN